MTLMTGLVASIALSTANANPVSDAQASLDRIKAGNERYTAGKMTWNGQDAARRQQLSTGQSPHTIVLACADSRVAPEIVFDQGLGDLFVVRVAGNIIDTHALASIEYAAEFLGTPLMVVMGHESCGAVDATVKAFQAGESQPNAEMKNITGLVNSIMPSVVDVKDKPGNLLENAIKRNVELAIANSKVKSPILQRRISAGQFKIVGGVYDLDTGKVHFH